ncbi:MAG TPA: DUF5856 family protein [Rickettsiales bacterium]|nr:DUF5856 family protein [Rickettsiales bacterium]
MLELLQRLLAFKYSCKLNHWKTDSYAKHLLFDRLQEDIDEFVDKIAEEYFMTLGKKKDLEKTILETKYIDKDLVKLSKDINKYIEKLAKDTKLGQGILSLLGNIRESFDGKLALLTLN